MMMVCMYILTEVSTVRLVEALQLCTLSLLESTRRRVFSFFDFLAHAVSNRHVTVACHNLTRPRVSHIVLLLGTTVFCGTQNFVLSRGICPFLQNCYIFAEC